MHPIHLHQLVERGHLLRLLLVRGIVEEVLELLCLWVQGLHVVHQWGVAASCLSVVHMVSLLFKY